MFKKLALAAMLVLTATVANAANITITKAKNTTFVNLTGKIELLDGVKFKIMTERLKYESNVVVMLNSPGGSVVAGLTIGYITHNNDWDTAASGLCASACADIWLAGSTRYVFDDSKIGMHSEGMKVARKGKVKVKRGDNKERIAYFVRLGLDADAIVPMLMPNPNDMLWLTPANAETMGIEYKKLG